MEIILQLESFGVAGLAPPRNVKTLRGVDRHSVCLLDWTALATLGDRFSNSHEGGSVEFLSSIWGQL